MKTVTLETNFAGSCSVFLKNLEYADKLRLISQLSDSLLNDDLKIRKEKLNKAFGSLDIELSAEEFINDLKQSRYFNTDKKIYIK